MRHTTTEENLETGPREKLRIQAEKLLTAEGGEFDQISPAEVKNLVLELKMRQMQLEMQNEELQRAQETITQARDRYADLYDFAPVGYFTLDRKGKIVDVNLAGARLLGVGRDLLVNQSSFRWVAPESREACRTHYRKVFDNQGPQTCEVKLRRRGGPPFYAALESVAAPGEAGVVLHCRTVMSDVTDRKQASEEIARLASFPQLNPNPVMEVDSAGNITFTNPAALETARKLGLQDVKSFLPADLREILKATGEKGERQFYREVEIKGTVLAAHIYFVPQFQVTRLFLLDITDRQRAVEELRLAAFKWRTTFDAIGDAVGPDGSGGQYPAMQSGHGGSGREALSGDHRAPLLGSGAWHERPHRQLSHGTHCGSPINGKNQWCRWARAGLRWRWIPSWTQPEI